MSFTLPTLYKRTSGGAVQEWTIRVDKMKSNDYGRMVTRYGQVDGKIQEIQEIISEGKNLGRKNATSPYEQACAEAQARWNKQKDRKGYGLDHEGEESRAIRSASPMLAKVFEKEQKKVQWDTAFAQPKLDGFRCLARREGKKIILSSRENQPFTALHEIEDALRAVLPEGVTLDGEIYYHGLSLPQVSSACKKRGELSKKVQYHIYDMVSEAYFQARHDNLYQVLWRSVNANGDKLIRVDTIKVRTEQELMLCQQKFLDEGYEGAMLRHSRVGYEAGKRSSSLLKVKTFTDAEFEVVDYKLGRGKYAGMPIFTCLTEEGHHFDVLAPGTLEEKRALGATVHDCVGKLLTVKFQYYTKTEEPVPFLPVAKGFRE